MGNRKGASRSSRSSRQLSHLLKCSELLLYPGGGDDSHCPFAKSQGAAPGWSKLHLLHAPPLQGQNENPIGLWPHVLEVQTLQSKHWRPPAKSAGELVLASYPAGSPRGCGWYGCPGCVPRLQPCPNLIERCGGL